MIDIDPKARLRFAELLRHFVAGRLTNVDYEAASEQLLRSGDPALWDIWVVVWFCYDDIRTHRLSGKWALTPDSKHAIARAVVFLHSDFAYEWPRAPLWRWVFTLLTLGMWRRLFPSPPSGGDRSVWPFFKRSDLETAAAKPRLLGGFP